MNRRSFLNVPEDLSVAGDGIDETVLAMVETEWAAEGEYIVFQQEERHGRKSE